MARGRLLPLAEGRLASYHAAAVMASNAIVAVLDAALLLMARAGIDSQPAREALAPLSKTTIDNVMRAGPTAALTGPVVRGDAATVAAHVAALADAPATVRCLYRAAADHLLELARQRGLDESRARALESALDGSR